MFVGVLVLFADFNSLLFSRAHTGVCPILDNHLIPFDPELKRTLKIIEGWSERDFIIKEIGSKGSIMTQ